MLHFEKKHPEEFQGGLRVGTLLIAPATLRKMFGEPTVTEVPFDKKADCEYEFCSKGEAEERWYTVYAFKATSLSASYNPSPEEFWAETEAFPFTINGRTDPTAFEEWVRAELEKVNG